MLVLFFIIFLFSFVFSKSLDNLDKIATYSILLKLTVSLLLFQISCGGKRCAPLWTGKVLNDESSFDHKKKNMWMTRTERDSTLASYDELDLWGHGQCLCTSPGLPGLTEVSEWRKVQGLSSRSVWMCAATIEGSRGGGLQNWTSSKNRPSTQNDSFLRHWCVYSNDGLHDVCVNSEGVLV